MPLLDTIAPNVANVHGVILPSAARTATPVIGTLTNDNARGVILFLNVTAASGLGGLVVTVLAVDPATGATVSLGTAPAARTTAGLVLYEWYPGTTASGGGLLQSVSSALPRLWLPQVAHQDASSYTYSLAYAYVV